MILSLILGFVIGAGAIIFILQNTATVALSFIGWQFESSLAIVVMLSMLVGIVFSLLASIPSAVRSSMAISRLKKQNKSLQEETQEYLHTAQEATARLNATTPPPTHPSAM
ncbi:LapA family protein [Patescibacteria group bacterium]|nr:LapA family protein [Patescibacteria group bacterium]MBU1500958.1 LapA family protein [Patescibacteria group bacterium]MBU2080588.1 LapA family protein [Patescibacteria group bacterium]MBU2124336.1 LapA family protein [Patescibacteria group bacterium]MBU2194462.1 LapA family protein [Patescibacteria group bacterium]